MSNNINHEEQQVLDIFKDLVDKYDQHGAREVRDGHKRVSVFGRQIRYDLSKSFPLLTHRQGSAKGPFTEVMWYLRGQTDNQILKDAGYHIWDLWEGIIDSKKPTELGIIYGAMLRRFGETLGKKGFDQVDWLLNEIKTNPTSSRLVLSNWNPEVSCNTPRDAVLPCCLTLLQFYVEDGKLSCHLYMRSHDISIANIWNTAQIALLTHLIAQQCDLMVGELVISFGDLHLYENQLEDVREMLKCKTHPFPQIKINKAKDLYSYEWSDIEIIDYQHSGKMENLKVAI